MNNSPPISNETPDAKVSEPHPVPVSPPLPQPDGAHALRRLLALAQEMPPEAAAEKCLQLTELIAALERCKEIPAEELETSTGLLAQMSDYFRRQSAGELGKCFLALSILRTRFYRMVGSLEDYASSIGVSVQTFRNWTYFAEIAERFGREASGLALPGTTELVTHLHNKLPADHWVSCWQGYLETPRAKVAGSANSFKKFLSAYRKENDLEEEEGNKHPKADDHVIGIESLDACLDPELLEKFRSAFPGFSPCLRAIFSSATLDLGDAESAALRRAAQLINRMRDENSDDYKIFINFSLRVLLLSARRQTSEVLAGFDPIANGKCS
ncbi:MAG: hypothetical protein ACOYM3_13455 [Terrimicrobiaceae bacterium]